MSKIKLSKYADVIDTALVRKILYQLSYGARRENDYLVVYGSEFSASSLYIKEVKNEQGVDERVIARLYCDEGFQSSCLHEDGYVGMNRRWIEMCDMNHVLSLIVKSFNIDFNLEPSGLIGTGGRKRHAHAQYIAEIERLSACNDKFKQIFEVLADSYEDRYPSETQIAVS